MFKKYIYVLIVLLFMASCVDPLEIDVDDQFSEVLVVEGGINSNYGPHSIYLTKSAKYGSVFDGVIQPIENAIVSIRDNDGNNQILTHEDNGQYVTSTTFKGEVGKGYILIIEWDGKTFNSTQEFIEKSSELDSIYPVFSQVPVLNENGVLGYKSGTDIYAKYKRESNTADYYFWNYEGVYYVRTFPEQYIFQTRRGPVSRPKDCCAECYRSELNNDIIISSFPLGNDLVDSRLFFLEDDGYRFSEKYVMTVTRQSLSQGAFEFFDLIRLQLEIDGDIFDPPPATVRGNIINIDNTNELIVGYFLTTDITVDTLSIAKQALPTVTQLPVYPDDCQVLPNTTTIRPSIYNF
jgi:hypothetical protein